jgi:hypothetical protein
MIVAQATPHTVGAALLMQIKTGRDSSKNSP